MLYGAGREGDTGNGINSVPRDDEMMHADDEDDAGNNDGGGVGDDISGDGTDEGDVGNGDDVNVSGDGNDEGDAWKSRQTFRKKRTLFTFSLLCWHMFYESSKTLIN